MNMQDKFNSSAQGVWFDRRDRTVIFFMVTEQWTLSGLSDSQNLRFVQNVRTQNQEKYSKNIC